MTEHHPAADDVRPDDAVLVPPRRQTPLYRWLSAALLRIEARSRARGSRGTRLAARAVWSLVAAVGILLLVGPVINEPMGFDDYIEAAGTSDETWIARSFEADYTLVRDADGRLRMEVEERITALFPEGADESGVERVIAGQYEGHDVRPTLVSAEFDGVSVEPEIRERGTSTEFSVDAGERLEGDHDLVLRYTLQDVAHAAFDESTRAWTDELEWDAFGPDWRHGSGSTTVSVTVPRDLVDAFARDPRAGLSWLLVSSSVELTADSETPETITYEVVTDQNLPPHSAYWFRMHFDPGTFAMPAPPILYWVMVVGPFVPLLAAVLVLLLALAARAVAWGDARGRAWFVPQSQPDPDLPATVAARLWRAVGTATLVRALADYQETLATGPAAPRAKGLSRLWRRRRRERPEGDSGAGRGTARQTLARELHRTGRVGNWPHAWREYLGAPAWRDTFERGLRRVPAGFVRDNFAGASLALPVLQLGLARQLSHQFPLSVYWWPVAVVALTTALGLAVLAIAYTARPLTRRGTFAREHLLGIRLFAEKTLVAERATLGDPLLPYAVMFAPPRRAAAIVRRAMDDAGVDRTVARDPGLLGGGRIALRTGAVLLVVVAFALANLVPSPTVRPEEDAVFRGDVPGSYGVFVREFAADGMLERDADGGYTLAVEERLAVSISGSTSRVPQVMRQWTDRAEGVDTGLVVTSVTVDGEPVEFVTSRLEGKALLQTTMPDAREGEHDVVISYRLEDPVITSASGGEWHDEIRWTALNAGWTFGWEGLLEFDMDTRVQVERVGATLTVPAELADTATAADALAYRQGRDFALREPDRVVRDGDTVSYILTPEPDDDGDDLGLRLTFDEGALEEPHRAGAWLWNAWRDVPPVATVVLSLLALAAGAVGIIRGSRLRSGALRDVARWVAPAAAAATLPVFVWTTGDWSGDEPAFAGLVVCVLAALAAAVWSLVATRAGRVAG
jgi:hypothetical protein